MASLRPTIDHTLVVWLVSHLQSNPPESIGDKIISSQIVDLYSSALSKAGLGNLLNSDNPITVHDIPATTARPLKLKYPFEQVETLDLSEAAKDGAMEFLATNNGITDISDNPDVNLLACNIYRAHAFALEETGRIFPDRINYQAPVNPINKAMKLPPHVDSSEL